MKKIEYTLCRKYRVRDFWQLYFFGLGGGADIYFRTEKKIDGKDNIKGRFSDISEFLWTAKGDIKDGFQMLLYFF